MRTWLKVIGSGKVPITGHPFYGNYNIPSVGFRKPTKPGIRMGDHLFLYAAGGSKRIFAMAEATGDPWYDNNCAPQDDCPWKLSVRYLMHCRVEAGIHIDEIGTDQRDLMLALRQASHIALSPEESRLAYSKLREKTDELEQARAKQEAEGAFSPSGLEDARKRIMAAIVVRQGQSAFRAALLAAYQGTCAATGCDVVEALEAAHIVPYLGPDTNHVNNGLLLRGDIHTLFDLSLMALNPSDYRLLVSKRLKGRCYQLLAGQVIRLPVDPADHPSREALEIRLAEFRSKEHR